MKIAVSILFLLFSINCFPQRQIKLTTSQITDIATRFGVDSSLKIIQPSFNLEVIDTPSMLSLALMCKDLKNYSRQFLYFSEIGQKLKNYAFVDSSIQNIQYSQHAFFKSRNNSKSYFVIPDEFFLVLAFQNNISVVESLKEAFNFWEERADSIHNAYPSLTKRFFQNFKGIPPSERLYSDCKENSFKICWLLNELGAKEFPLSRAYEIRKQLVPYHQDYKMKQLESNYYYFKPDTIQLNKAYTSLYEIDVESEMIIKKTFQKVNQVTYWQTFITNNNTGLFGQGCREIGGEIFKLELIKPNSIIITKLQEWIN